MSHVPRGVFRPLGCRYNRRWDDEGGKVVNPQQILQHASWVVSQSQTYKAEHWQVARERRQDLGADIHRKWKHWYQARQVDSRNNLLDFWHYVTFGFHYTIINKRLYRYWDTYLYLYLKLSSCLQGLALSPKASEYSWPVPSVTLIYSHMDATTTAPLCPTRISSTVFNVHSTIRTTLY